MFVKLALIYCAVLSCGSGCELSGNTVAVVSNVMDVKRNSFFMIITPPPLFYLDVHDLKIIFFI